MFLVQVSYTIISFTWWIFRTMSLFISITFTVYLMPKRWRCFFIIFFFIRYTILFCPFTWVFCFLNNLFSFDKNFRSFFSFILARNTFFVWKLSCYTCSRSRHTRKTWNVFSKISFFWLFYVGTFIRKTGWWNRPWFIYLYCCIICFSYFRSPLFIQWPWFIQWYTLVWFIE